MSAAMMAPTALPAFAVYEELGDNVEINLLRLLLGYLTVWIVFLFLQQFHKWPYSFMGIWIIWVRLHPLNCLALFCFLRASTNLRV